MNNVEMHSFCLIRSIKQFLNKAAAYCICILNNSNNFEEIIPEKNYSSIK